MCDCCLGVVVECLCCCLDMWARSDVAIACRMSHVAAAARCVARKCLTLSFAFVVHCVGVVLCVLVDNAIM